MVNLATDKYTTNKILNLEYQNKNRIEKRFNKGDYVFVLDRMQIPGNTRPLKTRFHPSPYVVINTRHTTTQVQRLADGFQSVYSNGDLKKYDYTSPLFANLPPQVSKVLLPLKIIKVKKNDFPLQTETGLDNFQLNCRICHSVH